MRDLCEIPLCSSEKGDIRNLLYFFGTIKAQEKQRVPNTRRGVFNLSRQEKRKVVQSCIDAFQCDAATFKEILQALSSPFYYVRKDTLVDGPVGDPDTQEQERDEHEDGATHVETKRRSAILVVKVMKRGHYSLAVGRGCLWRNGCGLWLGL